MNHQELKSLFADQKKLEHPLKVGGPGIAVNGCSYVATETDRWLYLNDDGNNRFIRVKLGYHAEQRTEIKP